MKLLLPVKLQHVSHSQKAKEGSTCTSYGLIRLPDSDTGTDSDSDSKPDGYIVLCRTYSHCTD